MTDITNYLAAWLVYSAASVIYFFLYWKITAFRKHLALSWYLRAVMLGIIITPWYVGGQSGLMAPALIVLLMDSITIGGSAAIRALVPLVLAIALALVMVSAGLLFRRSFKHKPIKQASD